MAKVTLTIKTKNENGEKVATQESFAVDKVTTYQVLKMKTAFGGIMKELKENDQLKTTFEGMMKGELDVDENKEAGDQAMEVLKDDRFVNGIAGAFDNLIESVPEQLIEMMSIASDIEMDKIGNAPFEEIFDVYDAIIQENDIKAMVERVKKSLNVTKSRWTELVQKATS